MSRKIIGVTVGTPMKPQTIAEKIKVDEHMNDKEIHVKKDELVNAVIEALPKWTGGAY